jgi:L,D-transpeptidase catalytic domain
MNYRLIFFLALLLASIIGQRFAQANALHKITASKVLQVTLAAKASPPTREVPKISNLVQLLVHGLYEAANLAKYKLDEEVLGYAFTGYLNLRGRGQITDKGILTVIDFSKPSTEKRLWIIDVVKQKLLLHTYVAHGVNSGSNYATEFSNVPESFKSSLGFYVTAETYEGKHGLSLALDGAEPTINCKARERAIVLHGSDYVSAQHVMAKGRLGRSQGCPAVPMNLKDKIIKLVKNRTALFIYYPDEEYLSKSTYLNNTFSGLVQ